MAINKVPDIVHNDIIDGVDTPTEIQLSQLDVLAGGRSIVTKDVLLDILRQGQTVTEAVRFAIDLFADASDDPQTLRNIAEDFMYQEFGYNVQSGENDAPLFIRNGYRINPSEVLSVVELSPTTCDQFAKIFLAELPLYPPIEQILKEVEHFAVESYIEGAFSLALYEHLLVNRWLSEKNKEQDFKRYTRAAKRLMTELIGDNDLLSPEMNAIGYRIAGGIAFNRMLERLRDATYFEGDPFDDRIIRFRSRYALEAIRRTDDEFFLGVATPLGNEEQCAYIATAAAMATPRPCRA